MKILIRNIKGLNIPKQAYENDAGIDVVATSEPKIVGEFIERPIDGLKVYKRIDYIEYQTSLFVQPQSEKKQDYHIELFPRSSLSNYNLSLANSIGLIDQKYTGELLFRFKYIFQPEDMLVLPEYGGTRVYGVVNFDKIYKLFDKIGQLVVRKTVNPINFELVEKLPETVRGEKGFGSSNKKI